MKPDGRLTGVQCVARMLLLALACLSCLSVRAQLDDIEQDFVRASPQEEARLRAVLAEPVPSSAQPSTLDEHFRAKDAASRRLGDLNAREQVFRQWSQAQPSSYEAWNGLANLVRGQGMHDEAIAFRRKAVATADRPARVALMRSRLVRDLYSDGRNEEAQAELDATRKYLDFISRPRRNQYAMTRARFELQYMQSLLHERVGRMAPAVASAIEAESYARQALELARNNQNGADAGGEPDAQVSKAANDIASALARKIQAQRGAGQLSAAEESFKAYLRLSREVELARADLANIYAVAANLRFSQREFLQSETYARKADALMASFGLAPLDLRRAPRAQDIAAALEGQRRWADALALFEQLDALAGDDKAMRARVRFAFERGLAYLWNNRPRPAAELFAQVGAINSKRYPAHHFFVAQAQGLQGVALWRSQRPEARLQAVTLLKESVQDIMSAANADYLENIGYRKETRELIFATYLEALSTTPGEDAMLALGPADWVRGGVVQEALADAAARSATNDPALSDIVRQDQDARNEIQGLRKFLAGESGGTDSPLPEIAAKMRDRITELEAQRLRLQAQLKTRFPEYERLVRPRPPGVAEIAASLAPDEALLMLLPTDDAVYVWAVNNREQPAFARVEMPLAQLAMLVTQIRKTLDFSEMGGRVVPFNAQAASDLYQRLLQPVQAAFAAKRHIVVAAAGPLSQLPFGVLLTQPSAVGGAQPPWLIRQAAITHVPSLSAWLAVKQFAKARSANEPLIGWGDPQFGSTQVASAAASTRQVVLSRSATSVDLEREDAHAAIRYSDIPRLPETRDELLAIAATLRADPQADLRLGAAATKESVLQSSRSGELLRKKVLVFATHGLRAGDLPRLTQPALALAGTGAEAEDPIGALLRLEEVLSLKLNADWVVLSACNTASADGTAEEALSGLARGFFYAGSRSLLVTHWAVESESAKRLTTGTFEHYTQNPQERKAESLRQSMLKLMAQPDYAHPAFWAPYALVGDGGR